MRLDPKIFLCCESSGVHSSVDVDIARAGSDVLAPGVNNISLQELKLREPLLQESIFQEPAPAALPIMAQKNDGAPQGKDQLRVLVVDDHDDMLTMMNLLMTRRSYCVATANSAHQALHMVEGFLPHIVVSDIGMPDMDGYEMMSAMRAMNELTPFKAIALTGYDASSGADHTHTGYDTHLLKPVNFPRLFELIDEFSVHLKQLSADES